MSRGISLARRGFRVGRQAQIMPVLHSMADQEAAPTLSSIGKRGLILSYSAPREGFARTGWI